jgi:hypothetical protein
VAIEKPIALPLKLHDKLSILNQNPVMNAGIELEPITVWKVQGVPAKIAIAWSNSNRKPVASGKDLLQR